MKILRGMVRVTAVVLVLGGCGMGEPAAGGGYDEYANTLTEGDPVKRLGMDTWFSWTAGNQAFWGRVFPVVTQGEIDLLRLLDNRNIPRSARFNVLGTINDPSCVAGNAPDPYGFFMDVCTDPTTDPRQLALYGQPTGIIGLRKFPNPNFNSDYWAKAGGAAQYLSQTPDSFDPKLEPPYLIGMACSVCHVGFNPLNPPANPAEPSWANLAPAIGNSYLQEGRVFTLGISDHRQFRWQAGQFQPPGTSDTSRIPDDFLNNPTAINPVFNLKARLDIRTYEKISHTQAAFIRGMVPPIPADLRGNHMLTAHGLMDGADSVGLALGSLRVYCNIGGLDVPRFLASLPTAQNGYTQQPFDITAAKAGNPIWAATESFMPALQEFLTIFGPFPLSQAPGGSAYLWEPPSVVRRGKILFADHCASCHSSKQPSNHPGRHRDRRDEFRALVLSDDFLDNNFLSDDHRYPLPQIDTHSARSLATNATSGEIWDNFSSETYKDLPSTGYLKDLFNPLAPRSPIRFRLPEGGPGYYRTSTLVSMWATAPYLHNNSLGSPTNNPSVAGRMEAFDEAVHQLLWPETRRGRASVPRTPADSYLTDAQGNPIPVPSPHGGPPQLFKIPAGTPIDLFANLHPNDLPSVVAAYARGGFPAAEAQALKQNRCPDFVQDHGHRFGTDLFDSEKMALIAYLKRL
jgi:hypothetical protein